MIFKLEKILEILKKVRALLMSVFGFDENKNKIEVPECTRVDKLESSVKELNGAFKHLVITESVTYNNAGGTVSLGVPFSGYDKKKCHVLSARIAIEDSTGSSQQWTTNDANRVAVTDDLRVTLPASSALATGTATLTLELILCILN